MAIEDVVQVTITRQSRPLERAGFGTLLHLSMHRAWDDLIKYYTQAADLLDDGFSEDHPAYLAASSYFLQEPKPQRIAIGRLGTDDAVLVLTTETTDGLRYTVFIDGIGFDYQAGTDTTTTLIEAGLTTVINSGYTITAASTANDTFTIAGNHFRSFPAGEQFRVTGSGGNNGTYTVVSAKLVSGNTVITVEESVALQVDLGVIKSLTPVTCTNTTAWDGMLSIAPDVASTYFRCKAGAGLALNYGLDGTMAANLEAIEAVDKTGWYSVSLAHQWHGAVSPAESETQVELEETLADEIELRRKIFLIASADADIVDTTLAEDDGTTGSIIARLKDKGYARSGVLYNAQANDDAEDPYADAAQQGSRLPTDPGRETWAFAELKGVTADELDATQRINALAKNCNIYTPYTSDRNVVEKGTMANGEFIDVVRLADAIHDAVLVEVGEVLVSPLSPLAKTPFTASGLAQIEAAIKRALDPFTGPTRGLESYTVTMPDIDSISDTDKTNRVLPDVLFTGKLTGAVHAVEITGSVTV